MTAVDTQQSDRQKAGARPDGWNWSLPPAREVLLVLLVLLLVAAAALGPYISHGGFFLDDWADSAGTLYTPGGRTVGHVLSYFNNLFEYRPVLVVYTPLKYSILGTSIPLNLVWVTFMTVLVALLVFTILRTMGLPWAHAGLIAVLTLVYPWYDSLRFWVGTNPPLLGVFIAFVGIQVALIGVIRRSWRWHAAALVIYLLSVLAYELTAPVIVAAGFLYVMMMGFRSALSRWAADVVVVVTGLLWVGTHTDRPVSGFSNDLDHLWEIVKGGRDMIAWTFYPLGSSPRTGLVFVALGLVLIGGLIVYLYRRGNEVAPVVRWGLREWLLLGGAGLAVAALGWVMFIPADPYYTPSVFGATNRVNALSGYGLVILAYAVVAFGVAALGGLWRPLRRYATLVTVLLMVLLGAAWVHVLERHARSWEAAYRAERTALDRIEKQYPNLEPGTTLFASNYPSWQALGVPIFAYSWDLNGAVQDEYESSEISASPVLPNTALQCRADGIGLSGEEAPETFGSYGSVKLLDLSTGLHAAPRNRHQCEKVAPKFVPGPEYVQYEY
ncbi:MAG TPA: hypothetical protein VG448_09710 [Solirubrobacterales bacterium]|nr:hypothetical protein [Solirubrobacterales bacterium]